MTVQALAPLSGAKLLDVGCGAGDAFALFLEALGEQGTVVGVDRDADLLAAARARHAGDPRVSFQQADASSLPFPDASFDAVTSSFVLQHIAAPRAAVAEWVRV
jgi:demethylmenaquinone methyltransferase/2-methoxy-6-polyprenyl-1,4-benzoquinol methylase